MPEPTDTPQAPPRKHARLNEDPRRLALQRWIALGGILEGVCRAEELPGDFPRLAKACCEAIREPLVWRAVGLLESSAGSNGPLRRAWLNLQAHTQAALRCNRCLDTVCTEVHVRRRFLVVEDEASAARLDAPEQDDFDVIAGAQDFDLLGLLEDELLLALPIVPMHAQCALPTSTEECRPEATQAPRLGTLLGRKIRNKGTLHPHRGGEPSQESSRESKGESPRRISGESPED
jgi:uncharacterized protein